ncbi:MAG: hypothetical protein IKM35_01435, partial [Bacteroidaceae bacterium]|nr:hypothetical protein [Bacteroidaceae bacterium]
MFPLTQRWRNVFDVLESVLFLSPHEYALRASSWGFDGVTSSTYMREFCSSPPTNTHCVLHRGVS